MQTTTLYEACLRLHAFTNIRTLGDTH